MRVNDENQKAVSRRTRRGASASRNTRFEVSEDFFNTRFEASSDEDEPWIPQGTQGSLGRDDIRTRRGGTPASLHSDVSGLSYRTSRQGSVSASITGSDVRRLRGGVRRVNVDAASEPHPYGLEARRSVTPTTQKQSAVVWRKEVTTKEAQISHTRSDQSETVTQIFQQRSVSSESINSTANNNGGVHLMGFGNGAKGHHGMFSDSENSDGEGEGGRRESSSSQSIFVSTGRSAKILLSKLCSYVYLSLMWVMYFEKWCLFVNRSSENSGEGSVQGFGGRLNGNAYSNNMRGRESHFSQNSSHSATEEDEMVVEESFLSRLSRFNIFSRQFWGSRTVDVNQGTEELHAKESQETYRSRLRSANTNQVAANEEDTEEIYEESSNSRFRAVAESWMNAIRNSEAFFRKLYKLFLVALLVILLIYFLSAYGRSFSDGMLECARFLAAGVVRAFNEALSVLTSIFGVLLTTMRSIFSMKFRPGADVVVPNPSSVKTEEKIELVEPKQEAEKAKVTTVFDEKAITDLKIKVGEIEKTLADHGKRLTSHDTTLKSVETDVKHILSAMKAASAKEKSLQEIVDEVLAAKIGETKEGVPVTLVSMFNLLNEGKDKERVLIEIQKRLELLSEGVGNVEVNVAELKSSHGNIENLKTEINAINARVQHMEGEAAEVKEQIRVQSRVQNVEVDEEKIQAALLPVLMKEIESRVVTSCDSRNCPESGFVGLSEEDIQLMIKRAISIYDADKTGLPDLALESAGGSILSTRCTKSSDSRNSVISYWGFPLWSSPNSPRTIIQAGVVPGECWAFEGSVGDVVIKLAVPSFVTGFTLEHIPKTISRYNNIDSAPKNFQVLGLQSEHDTEQVHDYGTFTYEDNDEPLQYFAAKNVTSKSYPIVELKVLSNHGNMKHTCIYRFRVHGGIDIARSHGGNGGIGK